MHHFISTEKNTFPTKHNTTFYLQNQGSPATWLWESISNPIPAIKFWMREYLKANLHWGVARSSRARLFVWFVASRSCRVVHERRITRRNKTNNRARLLLATPQCRLALSRVETGHWSTQHCPLAAENSVFTKHPEGFSWTHLKSS